MSKWTDVRDNVVDALHVDDVTDDLKNQVTNTLLEQVMPIIENAVDSFAEKVKAQAPQESGWCRVRDGIVLPLILEGLVFVVKTVLTKALDENVKVKEEPSKGV